MRITTRAMLDAVIERRMQSIREINLTKGREYASDADALANLRPHAELGITGLQRWGVYFEKHVRAILSYCGRGETLSEPIESRIDDAILYLLLLAALVEEGNADALDAALAAEAAGVPGTLSPADRDPIETRVFARLGDGPAVELPGPSPEQVSNPDWRRFRLRRSDDAIRGADGGPAGEAEAAAFLARGGDADGGS